MKEEMNGELYLGDALLEKVSGGESKAGYVCRDCGCTQILQVGSIWQCTYCRRKGPCENFWTKDVEKTLEQTLEKRVVKTETGAHGGW